MEMDDQYDVVIIGSGLGGLLCGDILSREGYRVCILEKNRQLGGSLQTFVRDKTIFDTGVHYVGGLGKGQPIYKLFKYLEIFDQLKLETMDEEGFDRVVFKRDGSKFYLYGQGYDKFIENLVKDFPDEREAIVKYCDTIRGICKMFPMYNLNEGTEDLLLETDILSINAVEFLTTLTSNKKLQGVLAATNVLYAGEAAKSPLYVHALIINSYILSSHRFINGSSQVSILLARSIRKNNGTLINYANVKKLEVVGENIQYAELADGRKIFGKTFISAIHPAPTLDMLDTDKLRKAYRNRIKSLENTKSAFILYLVMKENTFEHQKYNIYYYDNENVWDTFNYTEETWGRTFALYYSASSKSDKYSDGIIIITYMNYEDVAKWEGTFNTVSEEEEERGEEYEQFKIQKSEKLLDSIENIYPDIRKHIKSYYSSTPLTFRDYIGTYDGSLYGTLKDCNNPLKSFIPVRTKIPNLFFTGQNLHMHGVYGVAIGALKTCSEFLGQKYLLDKINKAVAEEK